MQEGTIKKLVEDRGFGFITDKDGRDLFFHRSGTAYFDDLRVGDTVSFESTQTDKGARAERVALLQEAAR